MNAASSSIALPTRGLSVGGYPQRDVRDAAAYVDIWRALCSRLAPARATRLPRGVAESLHAERERLQRERTLSLDAALAATRLRLRREGSSAGAAGAALALAAEAMRRTLGKTPYDTQLLAAWLMLNGRLVEMATGEGKTLAAALAASVAALAGTPVHVLTANDYLVQRDRDALAPLYAALGASVACVTAAHAREQRAQAWQRDIVYATAKELVFDYLRDHLALGGERDASALRARAIDGSAAEPALPGLWLAIVDEADSVLLDEAVVPLILAAPLPAADSATYRRAFAISRTLQRRRDYTLAPAPRKATLLAAGRMRVAEAADGDAALAPVRRACELVESALQARLLLKRDRDYALLGGRVQLIDELTGRIAEGRQWQGALHAMVELKEGLQPSAPSTTAAQITYQRFFPRYLRLGGMSGTLREARHELRVLYDAAVVRVPLARPDRRHWLGQRCCVDADARRRAVIESVRRHVAQGRPVLVGTDSVAESALLSVQLHGAGIAHQLLNAVQDADEAARIARAGCSGCVTVATNIAGRGTDIRLDADAATRGGLHVIATMRNRARRIDRQLLGRAARHGDPGSGEAIVALDDPLLAAAWPAWLLRAVQTTAHGGEVPARLARPLFALAQRVAEWRERAQRRALRQADRQRDEMFGFAGVGE